MKDERRPTRNAAAEIIDNGNGSTGLRLVLPPEALEQLVERVAERVREEIASSSPWLDRQAAAQYLGVPVSRLEKDRTAPAHRWGGRVFYDRRELDRFMETR